MKNDENLNMELKLCKYQGFQFLRVRRSQIKEAVYNPRVIDEQSDKMLRKSLKSKMLVEALVWNKRNGVLVGGHQRLRNIDLLQKYQQNSPETDYLLDVCAIDVDEKREKELNIILNNTNLMGHYDEAKLAELFTADNINFSDVGFTQVDIETMFTGTELNKIEFQTPEDEPEQVKNDVETIQKMKELRKTAKKTFQNLERDDYFFVCVFNTPQNLDKFLAHIGAKKNVKYIGGELLASKLGLELPIIEPKD